MSRPPIAAVAIRFQGQTWSLPRPYRHHDVIRMIARATGVLYVDGDQGFLDAAGQWLDRKQALEVALENGQVRNPAAIRAGQLFSEDVW